MRAQHKKCRATAFYAESRLDYADGKVLYIPSIKFSSHDSSRFLCVSFPLIACSAALAQDKTSLNRGGYGSVMTPEQVVRELGPETGLLPGDQAYEGRPVKSVSVRYRSTGKTVSEDRLKTCWLPSRAPIIPRKW